MAHVFRLVERVPHSLVLCGDHLSLQAGCSRGWNQVWGEQGRGAAASAVEAGGWGEVELPLCPCSGGRLGSDQLKLLAEPQPPLLSLALPVSAERRWCSGPTRKSRAPFIPCSAPPWGLSLGRLRGGLLTPQSHWGKDDWVVFPYPHLS